MRDGYLVLANGQVFPGWRYGEEVSQPMGELVFTTAMTGYMETLTDPSYYGQMVVQTFPLIGNCGVIKKDTESGKVHMAAYIAQDLCETPNNFRSEGKLDAWLKHQGVPAFCLPETRCLTLTIRTGGAMAAVLSHTPELSDAQWQTMRNFRVEHAVPSVTTTAVRIHPPQGPERHRVVLWDFGAKASIARMLCARGCEVHQVPAGTTAEQICAIRPDGVLLSNGPGDPAENAGPISELRKLMEKGMPIFGICLGHQLMAMAAGARTRKMKFGHRGANQPVVNTETGRCYITSQNHGYCVEGDSLPQSATMLYTNANDGTCEGVRYKHFPGFSVQFHPEACGGPKDTGFLFDAFIEMIKGGAHHA